MKRLSAAALPACLALAAFAAVVWWQSGRSAAAASLVARVAQVQGAPDEAGIDCAVLARQHPVVLLVLGQSNAANHGAAEARSAAPLHVVSGGRCYRRADPLPGATGQGASLWPRVAAALDGRLRGRPLVFSIVAVDSTTIADWNTSGPLRSLLEQQLQGLSRAGFKADLVLWQQGEADARAGTSSDAYRAGLSELHGQLRAFGVTAPMVLALSTYCPRSDGGAVRQALRDYAHSAADVLPGPDTDVLQGAMRSGGCHFSAAGLDAAARLWADALAHPGKPATPG